MVPARTAALVHLAQRGGLVVKAANNAPFYAAIYTELAELFRGRGYALAAHGSLARDFDLVAVPWGAEPATPDEVVKAVLERWTVFRQAGPPVAKPHGRIVYTLLFSQWGDAALDLGFMPVQKCS
jgi:hypothetical protein